MEHIKFTKMHGIGNDYIYINCINSVPQDLERLAVEMSDRHCGIGGDGIILILPSTIADFKMRIFNADGSEALMCGNGSRCVGKYVYDKRLTDKTSITLETLSGIKHLDLHVDNGLVTSVTVDMGSPELECSKIPVTSSASTLIDSPVPTSIGTLNVTAVSMGNPHGVIFYNTPEELNLENIGHELEHHPMWPNRANIEFAHVLDHNHISMRVWERGSGETMACGTGACAVAVAAIINRLCNRRITVKLRGGDLEIYWDSSNNHVYMTGPATTVFEGDYPRLI